MTRRILVPVALATAALAGCGDATSTRRSVTDAPTAAAAPSFSSTIAAPIAGQYIVLYRNGKTSRFGNIHQMFDGQPSRGQLTRLYSYAVSGFAAQLSDSMVTALRADTSVMTVEPDQVVTISSSTELSAPWGLDRIDQHALPLSGSYTYTPDGTGVTAYIIDTGIGITNLDFGGRAVAGMDAVTQGGTAADCHGHGTHVAGTVGGTKYGVAKNVHLVAVRVLDCSGNGTTSGVIAGLDWVTQQKQLNPATPMVANMSLGGGASSALDAAVASSINAGVTYAIAAGNSTADACSASPARVATAITVGATGSNDAFASFSNYGSCVKINAPGVNITSDYIGSTTATAILSGTSMATPHVTGAAALYLSVNRTSTPAQVLSALTMNATTGTIAGLPAGTTGALLYTGFLNPAAPAAPASVTVTPSATSITVSQTLGASAVVRDASGNVLADAVTWTTSNGAVATVSATGLITAVSAGTATITATDGTVSGQLLLTVLPVPVATVTVALAPSIVAGTTATATATTTDASGTVLAGRVVTWTSSNTAVATVSAAGVVTGIAAGSATITATSEGKWGTAGVSVTPVPVATVSVVLAPSILAGGTATATATDRDASGNVLTGRVVTWSSSNASVATISAAGVVTGVAAGIATITATSEGKSGTAPVSVALVPVANVSVALSSSVVVNATIAATATERDASGNILTGRAVTWSSSNTAVATVSGAGIVTGVAAGSATITATSEGKSGSASVSVTVGSVSVSLTPASIVAGTTGSAVATVRDAVGNVIAGQSVVWTTSNGAVATVSASGAVTGVAAGTAIITATGGGRAGTATITVTAAPVGGPTGTITLAKTTIYAGDVTMATWVFRDASGNVVTPFLSPVSSNPAVATVNLGGQVAGIAAGTAQIRVTYAGVTASATVTVVAKPAGTITVTISPSTVGIGAIGLASIVFRDAAGNIVSPSTTVTFTSSNPSVAQAFGGGLYYATAAGTTVLTATMGATSGSATLTVHP